VIDGDFLPDRSADGRVRIAVEQRGLGNEFFPRDLRAILN
jgi:hypothetical protein